MLSIIVPTYREAGNLPGLAARIDAALAPAGVVYELIIADDDSPDETQEICAELAVRYPLRLILPDNRPKDLSLSVIDGIKAAQFETLVVMDADLSHPPEKILELLAELAAAPDAFVVGSRYVSGGSFDRDWSIWRFLNSWIATLLARPLVRCTDPMSGFFAFHLSQLPDVEKLRPVGYKIGLEIMVRGNFGTVREVPIAFADREIGASKMNLGQQLNYLRHLRRLYLYRFGGLAEFVHFGVVGASGFVIDVTFYYLFQLVGISHQVARALSFWPAVSWNWALNRRTTFGERERRPRGRQWVEFVLASLVGFSINWGVYVYLTTHSHFFDSYRILALLSGIVTASVFNFLTSTLFVYSEKRIKP